MINLFNDPELKRIKKFESEIKTNKYREKKGLPPLKKK